MKNCTGTLCQQPFAQSHTGIPRGQNVCRIGYSDSSVSMPGYLQHQPGDRCRPPARLQVQTTSQATCHQPGAGHQPADRCRSPARRQVQVTSQVQITRQVLTQGMSPDRCMSPVQVTSQILVQVTSQKQILVTSQMQVHITSPTQVLATGQAHILATSQQKS